MSTPKSQEFYLGKRISYAGNRCTVRYIGPVAGTKGEWLGVEWDDQVRGKHSGEAGGVKYFECLSTKPTPASFVRPNRPVDPSRLPLEALRFKYVADDLSATRTPAVRISGKELEEVGFDKINKQQSELPNLRIVLLDGLSISLSSHKSDDLLSASCPRIFDLDLSRNLFESFSEIIHTCDGLKKLTNLKIDGNRLRELLDDEQVESRAKQVFQYVTSLALEDTLLKTDQIQKITSTFSSLSVLDLSNNQLSMLGNIALPHSITKLTLSGNEFTSLSDLLAITTLPKLEALLLNHGQISTINKSGENVIFPSSLKNVELAFNAISTWDFIDSIPNTFPGIQSLRISHNALFQNLAAPDGRILSNEHGYMLTIARIASLKYLNYSFITEKDRLDAESYYLSLITQELQLNPPEKAADILKSHPRYRELCEIYGEPEVRREEDNINPNSLGAHLLELHLACEDSAGQPYSFRGFGPSFVLEIPKSFSVYAAIGEVARRLGLWGGRIQLYWQTDERQEAIIPTVEDIEPWDSEESDEEHEGLQRSVVRDILLKPTTRSIGNVVDGTKVKIRVVCMG